jgi:hypothetical protein
MLRADAPKLAAVALIASITMLLPVVCDLVGWGSGQIEFRSSRELVIHAGPVFFDPLWTRISFGVGPLILLISTGRSVWVSQKKLSRTQRELTLKTWHLHHLVPTHRSKRDDSSCPP